MDRVLLTAAWMTFNVFLAIVPIIFARIVVKTNSTATRLISLFVWFFFLPNTLYLLTDVVNLVNDVKVMESIYALMNGAIYLILIPIGIITFIYAVYPLEKKYFKERRLTVEKSAALFVLNLFIGFGLVLGRILRVNSWEVVTNMSNVIEKSFVIISSQELIIIVLVTAVASQIIYIVFKKPVLEKFPLK